MDTDKTRYRKAFNNLPEELQEVVASMKTVNDTRNIGKNSRLSEVQLDKTEIAVLHVLLGIDKPENFAQKLKSFDIDENVAQRVTAEIDKAVFWPVRDLLAIAQNNYKKIASETPTSEPPTEKTIASVLFARNNK